MGSRKKTTENGVQKEETAGSRERQLLLSYYKWLVNSMFDGEVESKQATSNPHEVIRMLWDFRSNDFLSLEGFEEFLGSHQGQKILRNSDDNSEDDEQMQPFVRRHRFNILVEEIDKSARPQFLPEWRTNVLKLVPEELKSKHPKLLQDTLTEITNIHGDLIKHIHLRSKLITKRRCQWMLEHVEKPFRKGFTDCYHIFKQNVEKLSNTLFMTHIAIKMVFEYCHQTLPNLIVNFKKYRSYRRLSQLVQSIHESIEICDNYLEKYWYTNLVLIMRDQDPLRSIDEEQWERFVKFANVIISENITELKRRSVQHILKYIGNPKKMPRLECFVRDGGQTITLRPPYEKYREAYMTILEKINEMFTGRTAIGSYLGYTSETSYLRTSLGKQYMKEAQDKVTEYAKITYSPVEEFFKELEKKYDVISVDHLQTELSNFLSDNHDFEDTWSFLERIRKVRRSLRDIPDFEYLNETSFRLNLAPFSKDLLNRVDSIKKQLVKDLVAQHLQGCEEICHQFENLTNVALAVPRTTSELCEFSSVLVSVNKEFVSTLERIITVPIKGLYKVMQVTRVTKHHSDTYTKMIHWIQDLPAILYDSQQIIEECRLKFDRILIERTENFNKELDEFPSKLSILNYMNEAENIPTYLVHTRKLLKTMDYFHEEEKWINNEETLLKYPLSSFPEIDEIKAIVMPFSNLISKMDDWQLVHRNWLFTRCNEFNAEEVDTTVNEFHTLFKQLLRDYRITIQSMIMENNPRRFQGSLDDPNNLPAPIRLCTQTLDEIEKFKPFLPYIYMLSNQALKQRHWDELSKLLEYDMTPDLNKYFKYIMELDLHGHTSEIEIISDSACREEALVNSLLEMKQEWKDVKLPMDTLKGTTISIICSLEDIQSILDTHLRKTFFIRGSAFVKPIEDETESWYKLLQQVSKIIDIWADVQSQWLRFRPIFQAEGMMVEMPTEASHFQYVDEGYKKLMKTAMGKQLVLKIARDEQIQYLPSFSERLEEIGEGIGKYFEKKRLMFPRFFFISDDELSKIITEKEKDSEIQPYLQKCFGGICALEFDDEKNVVSAFSSMAEKMKFLKPISTSADSGKVEHWLTEIEKGMICSVKEHILQSFKDYEQKRWIYWLTAWLQQAVLCASQLHWTADVENALSNGHLTKLQGIQKKIEHTLTTIIQLLRGDLVKTLRLTLGALTVLTEHANNVLNELIDKKVQSSHNFLWLAQLRYYLTDNEVVVRCTNTEISYAYEYLGNFSRLVITPLTERCYRILIGAHRMNMNGAVEGPTGTGKTEAVKDLAKAVAAHCFVFNCSQGLDYHIMGKFFKGIAASGSWACFDEFNRIDVEVLSVIAQQMLCIFQAVQQGRENFVFESIELKLNRSCFIAVTMNPEYVGRNELPENLKVYFRTVGMVVPDYTCIAKLLLLSYGFKESRDLAIKIVTVYKLCSDQLSSQCHYNFGMRELKAVLDASRDLKVRNPETNEVAIVLRSIHDVTRPKCLPADVTLFEWILSDVFHKETPRMEREGLKTIMKQACLQLDLEPEEEFIFKVTQTYELMIVRHGLMLIGEPFSGKTSVLKVLSNSIMNMVEEDKLEVRLTFINPKALSLEQLYGELDPVSLEWKDGVIPYTLREFSKLDTTERKWLIFDGPVDTKWIENLNTVLDDNRKLCLLSGDTILLSPEITFFFETNDLFQASPATVSRCGMIFMDLSNVGLKAIVTSWLKHLNKNSSKSLTSHGVLITMLVDWLFPTTLSFLKIHGVQLISIGEICLIHSTLKIVEMLLYDAIEKNTKHDSMRYWIKAAFVFATAWGIGGILDCKSRILFDEFCRNMWDDNNPESGIPGIVSSIDVSIPQTGLLYNYIYTFKGKGSWDYWPELVLEVKPTESVNIFQSLIPTVESERCQYLMQLHIKHNIPMLLIGPSGTGKSFYFQNTLTKKLCQDTFASFSLIFTSRTTAAEMQELIISRLKKHKSGTYAPYEGKKCVVFIDNLSMPVRDEYGSQPTLEHLRQYFDHHYWFDIKDNTKVYLDRTQFVAAAGITATNGQGITPRLLRHFSVYSMNKFPEESMSTIFSTLLRTAYKRGDFPSEIFSSDIINCIVQATNKLYTAVNDYLLPVPGKEHYLFNLRDYSNVIQGCSFLKKESAEDPKMPIRLWVHEILREFYDRLVDKEDRAWLYEQLRTVVKSTFSQDFDQVLDTYADGSGKVTEDSLADLMFGNFLRTNVLEKKYEPHPNIEAFYERAFATLTEYNKDRQFRSKLNIVLFRYVLDHLNRICRVISFPGGSVLLIGVYGSGRRSLVKLASCLTSTNLFEPDVSDSYDVLKWKQDVKSVLKKSGGHGKDTIFFFTEKQIKDEVFLEDIDFLLNCGEVPNIFQPSDVQEILDLTRLDAQGGRKILDISTAAVYAYFINRCKEKLHIVLSFNCVGPSLRKYTRLYPSFINCCTIDWFQPFEPMEANGKVFKLEVWPEEAFCKVAGRYLEDIKLTSETKKAIVEAFKYVHVTASALSGEFRAKTGRHTHVTPVIFIEFLKLFIKLFREVQAELNEGVARYQGGLGKLEFAGTEITELQNKLLELKPQIESAARDSSEVMKLIEKETMEVAKASELVKADEVVANKQFAASQQLKKECEAELAQAIPILEDAIAALNTLKPADITLVKSMKNPPYAVKLVMAAVCVLKAVKPAKSTDPATGRKKLDYWKPSKKILSDMYFLQTLRDFDKDNISAEIMQKIRTEYLPNKDFNPATVAKASSAAEGLCKWVLAMDLYDRVAKEVAPKKAKLEIANQQYNATLELLKTKQEEVDRLEAKLGKLRAELHMTHTKKGQLEDTVVEYTNRITRANKLIDGLGGEKDHWSSEAKRLTEELQLLPGDIFISCGIMIYLAPYSAAFRLACIGDWHKYVLSLGIPCSNEYSLRKVLGCELDIQKWIASELPRDDFSVDNAIIMDKAKRWPLLVDPQSQANKWIRNIEPDLIVLKLSDSDFMESLQGFASNGYPVLIENIGEEFNKELELFLIMIECPDGPLCHPSPVGKVGRTGPNSEGFRLYMTSQLRNPNFKPEIFNIVTVVDFTVTLEGLEEHLLSLFVAKERPDLESKYDRYIIRSALNRDSIQRSEDDILVILSKTPGNILQKEEAINQVDKSKELSKFVQEDQRRIERILEEIDEIRSRYRFTARYSAVLFYCVLDLANVNIMYQFSLEWFINLYTSNINLSQTPDEYEKRLKIFRDKFTLRIYSNTSRSLYDKDKVLFTFSLCTSTMLLYEMITDEELRFFLNPETSTDKSNDNPAENWLSMKTWDQLVQLAEMRGYEGFLPSFVENIESWEKFWYHPYTKSSEIPDPWEKKLSEFQKLLLIRVLRPDKVSSAVHDLIVTVMGKGFVTPPAFDLAEAFDESNYLRPIIVLLSPGSEPILAITNFANEVSFSDGFQIISLGQAQGPIAEEALIKAGKAGKWVCLENCHLAPSWIPNLEKIFDRITNEPDVSHGFRLWLTTYPSSKFPPTLLDKGLKLTNERSAGLRQRLYRPFISDPVKDPRFHDSCPFKAAEFYRLMYAVSFFNAVVQERINFGPIGWNVPYEFGESDLRISLKQLQVYLTEEGRLFSYDALRYHIGECNYGGRVMDPWDLRVLTTILSEYVNRRVVQDSNYHLHPGDEYGLPMSMTYSECLQLIEKLPDEPPTEVYGLHSNAGLKRDMHQSNDFLYSALMIRGEILRIENVISLQTVLEITEDILHKMPKRLDVEEAITKYPLHKEDPLNTVLIKEMERYNMLMDVLCSTLGHLKDAIQGIVLMTEDLQKMADSIFAGEVPEVWKTYSYPSIKPLGSYFDDFEHRIDSIEEWYNIGVLPSYWLPGIFSPHAFLVGVLQSYARTNTIPIDTLTFDCPVLGKDDEEPPTRGVHVYGLFMEGAAWNSEEGVLVEQPARIRQSSMPIIWIKPIRQSIYNKRNRYDCPLYITSERRGALCTRGISSNFVMTVPLKINGKVSHWIKRGVAMICQSDE